MSIEHMSLVWPLGLPPTEKLLLLKFCDRADRTGGNAYPSIQTVATACSISDRQAKRVVQALLRKGLLAVQTPATQHRPTIYRVTIPAPAGRATTAAAPPPSEVTPVSPLPPVEVTPVSPLEPTPAPSRGDTSDAPGVTSAAVRGDMGVRSGVTPMSPDTSLIRTIHPGSIRTARPASARSARARGRGKQSAPRPGPVRYELQQRFEEFWRLYPRKVAKSGALKAWLQRKPDAALLETMAAALAWQCRQERWLDDDGRFIPYPATWLRNARWLDERPKRRPHLSEKNSKLAASTRRFLGHD